MTAEEIIERKVQELEKELKRIGELRDDFDRLRYMKIKIKSVKGNLYAKYFENRNNPFEEGMKNISSYLSEETVDAIKDLIIADITPKIHELRRQIQELEKVYANKI